MRNTLGVIETSQDAVLTVATVGSMWLSGGAWADHAMDWVEWVAEVDHEVEQEAWAEVSGQGAWDPWLAEPECWSGRCPWWKQEVNERWS